MCVGGIDGIGGMATLKVGGAKRYIKLKASDVPKGAIVIAIPGGTIQGMGWETIRPPNGRKATAEAGTGTTKTPRSMKAATILAKRRTFSLYTDYMGIREYLPSAQFVVIVGALAISGGAVAAAQYFTSSKNTSVTLAGADIEQGGGWEQSLADIQAQSGVSVPDVPENAVQELLSQAQSDNLTDSIGRELLVQLTAAGMQGLGDDIPTQDRIIAEATSKINASRKPVTVPPLTLVDTTEDALRAYGNAVMEVFSRHPEAGAEATYIALAKATDSQDSSYLASLKKVSAGYRAIADQLAVLPVPRTLSPLHMQAVKNLYAITEAFPDLEKSVSDPLRGIAGLQTYQLLMGETGRVLTNTAEALKKGGILFSKDEPGSAWSVFLSAP